MESEKTWIEEVFLKIQPTFALGIELNIAIPMSNSLDFVCIIGEVQSFTTPLILQGNAPRDSA